MLAFQADARGPGADAQQLWVHESPKGIDHFALALNGNLLVMSDDRIAVLDRATGAAVWTRTDIRSCARARGNNPEDGQLALIDLSSGKTLFDVDTRALGKVRDLVVLVLQLSSSAHSVASP